MIRTYGDLKATGIFNLMPNGFNLYDDNSNKQINYTEIAGNGVYTAKGITISPEQLEEMEVTCIGSDPNGDLEVPAIWINISK